MASPWILNQTMVVIFRTVRGFEREDSFLVGIYFVSHWYHWGMGTRKKMMIHHFSGWHVLFLVSPHSRWGFFRNGIQNNERTPTQTLHYLLNQNFLRARICFLFTRVAVSAPRFGFMRWPVTIHLSRSLPLLSSFSSTANHFIFWINIFRGKRVKGLGCIID